MPRKLINGVELFYDEWGSGPALLFHHGYTGSHDSWEEIVPALAGRYRCVVMDARGAGDSAHPEGGYTVAQYADDVAGMAEALGLGRFTYIGHSMGGVIGMELGQRYGDRLEKLVLVAPAPSTGVVVPAGVHEHSVELRANRAREQMIRERTITTARPKPEHITRAVDRALSVSDGHFNDSWTALVDYRVDLSQVTVPTLIIAGAADGLLSANLADFQRLPNATLHVFSRVSHGIPREAPQQFTEVLADFLEHGVVTAATLQARLREAAAAGGR